MPINSGPIAGMRHYSSIQKVMNTPKDLTGRLRKQNDLAWYSDAIEVLSPLRWHVNELIEAMESRNRFAKKLGDSLLSEAKIAAAKAANSAVDAFFQPNHFQKIWPYQKISNPFIRARQKAGLWVCDSADHNEPHGCSNPDCFKHQ